MIGSGNILCISNGSNMKSPVLQGAYIVQKEALRNENSSYLEDDSISCDFIPFLMEYWWLCMRFAVCHFVILFKSVSLRQMFLSSTHKFIFTPLHTHFAQTARDIMHLSFY